MNRVRIILGLIPCGIVLYAILNINSTTNENEVKSFPVLSESAKDETEDEVKSFPVFEYHRSMNKRYGTRNISSNLPLCGLGLQSFIFNISSGKMLTGVHTIHNKTPQHLCKSSFKARNSLTLTIREGLNYNNCRKDNFNPLKVFSKNLEYLKDIRREFFHFLKDKKGSSIIEIGGFKGDLAKSFLEKYKIQHYVVVEPVRKNYESILENIKLLNRFDVGVYQFGLGKDYSEVKVNDKGPATSVVSSKSTGNSIVKIVNTIDFFLRLGVACHDVDLLIINCEGCEFDVLEMLVSTNLIDKFVHIQLQPHCRIKGSVLGHCGCRYCRIRQLLARTHEIAYSYPEIWEAWRRKPSFA